MSKPTTLRPYSVPRYVPETPPSLEPVYCDTCGQEGSDCTCCERVSMCCGAAEHADVENFCAACGDGTGFECGTHDVDWPDGPCPGVVR